MRTVYEINDTEWQESVIEAVEEEADGYAVTYDGGWIVWVRGKDITPKVGDTIRTYGRGIGSPVRGIAINGVITQYETTAEMESRQRRQIEEREAKQQTEAAASADANNARIAALPPEFVARIARFRRNNADFEWRYQPYELMVCEQAVVIAGAFRDVPDDIAEFAKSTDWEAQKARVPGLDDGHSGNSFGASCRLAWLYLTKPDVIDKEHGALCPLVGCNDYGCFAAEAAEKVPI